MKTCCVVVAAGRGERAKQGGNKVFADICGRSVLSRTLDALSSCGSIDEITLVISKDDEEVYEDLVRREGACPLVTRIAYGGETRRDSVYAGLRVSACDVVLVHDAARMYVTGEIIDAVIQDVLKYGSGVISTPVTDTVKQKDGAGWATATPDRSMLRAVQTPQAFDWKMLMHAYEQCPADKTITDDAAVFERVYGKVKLTEAESASKNIKLTTPVDFENARRAFSLPRMGTGYDVHRLVEGRDLILCGVKVPYEKGLLGHSDADVALHALMDALLGAAALGDIGHLFPDNDDRYLGISSVKLLKETNAAIRRAGFRAGNCDVTIVCQRPKLAPYINEMRANIAAALEMSVENVSVKATTTEKLGFEGEGLGISAQAVAVVFGGR